MGKAQDKQKEILTVFSQIPYMNFSNPTHPPY